MQLGKLHSQSYNQTRVTNMDSWLSGLGSRLAAVSSRVQIQARVCADEFPQRSDSCLRLFEYFHNSYQPSHQSLGSLREIQWTGLQIMISLCPMKWRESLYRKRHRSFCRIRALNRGCYVHTNPLEPRRHILWLRPARFSQKASPTLNQTSRANSAFQRVSKLRTL